MDGSSYGGERGGGVEAMFHTRITNADMARAQVALLDELAEEIAKAKGDMVRLDNMLRVRREFAKRGSTATSADKRETESYTSEAYERAIEEHAAAVTRYEVLVARDKNARQKIDVYRTELFAQGKGRI